MIIPNILSGACEYGIEYLSNRAYRLFAARCAWNTPLSDGRSHNAIEAAILYAYGKIIAADRAAEYATELAAARAAAESAARAAAESAARAAAEAAAYSAAQAGFLREFISWDELENHLKTLGGLQ